MYTLMPTVAKLVETIPLYFISMIDLTKGNWQVAKNPKDQPQTILGTVFLLDASKVLCMETLSSVSLISLF